MVYPNPSRESAVAQVSVREAGNANIKLVNNTGQIIYEAQWKLQPGLNLHPLPVTLLSVGTYFVRVEINKLMLQTTLVKQ